MRPPRNHVPGELAVHPTSQANAYQYWPRNQTICVSSAVSCTGSGLWVRERPPLDGVARHMKRRALPRTIMGYVVRSSGRHQIALAVLSAAVFGLSSVPLELQRRVVNDAIKNGATQTIMWLAIAYAGVAVLEQALKMALNVYRSWVSEDAVRALRKTLEDVEGAEPCERDATGTHTAMAVAEAEPIG